jgi:hypothetical protein
VTTLLDDLTEAAQAYAGWGYGAGLTVRQQDEQERIDCSSLTARLVCELMGERIGGDLYSAVVLTLGALTTYGPWAPVEHVMQSGLGEWVALGALRAGEVALVQEWSRLPGDPSYLPGDPGRGHAYLVIGTATPGRVHLLESTSHIVAGVSWRFVGGSIMERIQLPLDGQGPHGSVPIATLADHRAARLIGMDDAETRDAMVATSAPMPPSVLDAWQLGGAGLAAALQAAADEAGLRPPTPTPEATVPITLGRLPIAHALDLAADLVAGGMPLADAAEEVGALLDELVDWTDVVDGPAGVGLELIDGPAITTAVRLIGGIIGDRGLVKRAKGRRAGRPGVLRRLDAQRELVEAERRRRAKL